MPPGIPFFKREGILKDVKHPALHRLIAEMPGTLATYGPLSNRDTDGFFDATEGRYSQGGVVFCPTKSDKLGNGALSVQDGLSRMDGLDIGTFFGGGDDNTVTNKSVQSAAAESLANQIKFLDDRLNLMVATKAFGMGIDKPNIRYTVHYTFPSSVESFYQEAGRAGRDRSPSLCTILYHPEDVQTNLDFHEAAFKGSLREQAVLSELLTEVRYEPDFFLSLLGRRASETFGERIKLSLWPIDKPGKDPFLLFVNGPWHNDPKKRVGYGALHLGRLSKWQKKLQNATQEESNARLDFVRQAILEGAEGSDPLTWLRTTRQPGIEAMIGTDAGATHTLRIGFANDMVDEVTDCLKQAGNPEIEGVVVRHAYQFCDGPDDFVDNLSFRYHQYTDYRADLSLDAPTREFLDTAFYKIRDGADTQRAIYRLSILGIIDDYTVDYAQNQIVVTFKAKGEAEYRENFRVYLRRYLGVETTEAWLRKVDAVEESSVLKPFLWTLIDFVYQEIKEKRVRGIEYMRDLCEAGTAEGDAPFREAIVYYFTSKYARLDYLPKDLDFGRDERLGTVRKYIEYVFAPPDGLGGQIDNAKHLRGACARLLMGQSDDNAALLLLNAFSVLALETSESESTEEALAKPAVREAVSQYRRAYRRFITVEPWEETVPVLTLFANKIVDINPALRPLMSSLSQEWMVHRTVAVLRDINLTLEA